MTLPKHLTRFAIIGFAQVAIVLLIIVAFSGSSTSVEDAVNRANAVAAVTVSPEPVFVAEQADGALRSASFAGLFDGNDGFRVTGSVIVTGEAGEAQSLRFTRDFWTSSGSGDLEVVLRASNGDFISLGQLESEFGVNNYVLPDSTDVSVYGEVEIFDVESNEVLGSATLAAL